MESLARTLGVTKGGFYWHFADRGALLEEMLDAWERVAIDAVIEQVEAAGGDARERLHTLSTLAGAHPEVLRIDLAVRDWARRDDAVADRLRRADNRRFDYMRSLFGQFCDGEEEVEARCMVAFSIWIGNHFIAAEHGERNRADVIGLVMRRLEE